MVDPTGRSHIPQAKIEAELGRASRAKQMSPSRGTSAYALGMCRVVEVNYEEFLVTLRVVQGADDEYEHVPVPLTFPGAGARHFFGAMPQIGDYCVVGWTPQESAGTGRDPIGSRIPIIVSWVIPGAWPGQDWLTTQDFEADEYDFTEKGSSMVEGAHVRVRHKLPHLQPGNIAACSAQGSDLFLDEGVLLANRRGNEIRLRDQDQAFVLRSLQQFHVGAGFRIYGGMVQRDATLLATQVVSDGKRWDGNRIVDGDGEPIPIQDLEEWSGYPQGALLPAELLRRNYTSQGLGGAAFALPKNLDPYAILGQGLFLDGSGLVAAGHGTDAVYGGKGMYRVAATGTVNSVANGNDLPTFTEHRLEVAHTSDGRLPVTEQTDGFDADRLPKNPEGAAVTDLSQNRPYVEVVHGSVVGNDPFTQEGRSQYGLPLAPEVMTIDNEATGSVSVAPQLVPNPSDWRAQAASLFRIRPPMDNWGSGAFCAFTKDGRFKGYLGGDPKEDSLQLACEGNARIALGGQLFLQFHGPLKINHASQGDESNRGLIFRSSTSAVVIEGGGVLEDDTQVQNLSPSSPDGMPDDKPSVLIKGQNAVNIEANTAVNIDGGQRASMKASQAIINGTNNTQVKAGDRLSLSGKQHELTVTGRSNQSFSGPKDSNISDLPLRETTFTGSMIPPDSDVDKHTYEVGSRKEVFNAGNHHTQMQVGDMTYETLGGTWKAKSVENTAAMSPSGWDVSVTSGTVAVEAKAGAATLKGSVSATVSSQGRATVSGASGVTLGGPVEGTKLGGIVSGGDQNPINGQPLSSPLNGKMGSSGHTLGPAVST